MKYVLVRKTRNQLLSFFALVSTLVLFQNCAGRFSTIQIVNSDVSEQSSLQGGQLVEFKVKNLAEPGVQAFTFGHVFKQGDLFTGLNSKNLSVQIAPKNYWPDGSVKFAILSGFHFMNKNELLSIPLERSSLGGEDLTYDQLQRAVKKDDFKIRISNQEIDLFDLLSAISLGKGSAGIVRQWISGPVMSEWHFQSPLAGDEHVVVWMTVRLYKNNLIEVFPWVENGWIRVANPNSKGPFTVEVLSQGNIQFSKVITFKHHTRTPLLEGQNFSYWLDGVKRNIVPIHDTKYLMNSKLFPNYYIPPSIPESAFAQGDLDRYTINSAGNYAYRTGFLQQIGVVPNWCALYLTSGADPRAYYFTVVNGFGSGAHRSHYRDEKTNDIPLLSTHTQFSLSWSDSTILNPADWDQGIDRNPGGANLTVHGDEAKPESYRRGSMGYFPYLITGNYWFLEEHLFWLTWTYFEYAPAHREFSSMLFFKMKNIRNIANDLRDLGQALIITPSSHPMFHDLFAAWENTIDAFHQRLITGERDSGKWINNLGAVMVYPLDRISLYDSAQVTGNYWEAPWMNNYFSVFIGHLWGADVPQSAATKAKFKNLRDLSYKQPVGMAGLREQGGWDYRRMAYAVPYGSPGVKLSASSPPTAWFEGWGQVYTAYLEGVFVRKGGAPLLELSAQEQRIFTISGGDGVSEKEIGVEEISTYSGVSDHLAALSYAAEHNANLAQESRSRVFNSPSIKNHFSEAWAKIPVWSIVPRSQQP